MHTLPSGWIDAAAAIVIALFGLILTQARQIAADTRKQVAELSRALNRVVDVIAEVRERVARIEGQLETRSRPASRRAGRPEIYASSTSDTTSTP